MEGTEFKGMSDRSEYQESIAKALDKAIAKVAKAEFCRLAAKLNGDKVEIARAVENALRGLAGLQGGNQPHYDDEWLALLYSTWYQPSHINLAYSMIKAMAKQRDPEGAVLSPTGKLHVVDFGCGTLAMQFGVALAAADALQQGQRLTAIRIDLIDSSRAMIGMGLNIGNEFREEIGKYQQLGKLSKACELIHLKIQTGDEGPTIQQGWDSWLSAVHVVYADNKDKVKIELERLSSKTNPDVGFVTSHYSSLHRVKFISPFGADKCNSSTSDVQQQFIHSSGPSALSLWSTLGWRRNLYGRVEQYVDDDGFVEDYLSGNRYIPWKWAHAAILIHTKR